jgi:hypothetical protein
MLRTMILLISTSWVARIIGVSHWHLTKQWYFKFYQETFSHQLFNTLRCSLYRKGRLDAHFLKFIYQFSKEWIGSLEPSKGSSKFFFFKKCIILNAWIETNWMCLSYCSCYLHWPSHCPICGQWESLCVSVWVLWTQFRGLWWLPGCLEWKDDSGAHDILPVSVISAVVLIVWGWPLFLGFFNGQSQGYMAIFGRGWWGVWGLNSGLCTAK